MDHHGFIDAIKSKFSFTTKKPEQPKPTTLVEVRYFCPGCMQSEVIKVRERQPDQTLKEWLNTVVQAIMEWHELGAPQCSREVVDLRIPLSFFY